MSIKQMTTVWEHSRAEGVVLLVLLSLADHADDDGYCYPGIARLAKKCRISDRSVQRHIRTLQEMNELSISEGKGVPVNGGSTNRYRVNVSEHLRALANNGGDNLSGGDKSPGGVVTNTVKGGDRAVSPKPSGETSGEPSVPLGLFDSIDGPVDAPRQEPVGGRWAPDTKTALALHFLWGRRPDTLWSAKEQKALKAIGFVHEEDLDVVSEFYNAEWKKPKNYLRRDLLTFLNNFRGEVDRAYRWKSSHKPEERCGGPAF